jgi:serine/threonine protein kinase/tetratricopeptide (TPR) repeat protein
MRRWILTRCVSITCAPNYMAMQPGHVVAHYEILEKLGEGGMGVVYRARDTHLDRVVALKFLPARLSLDEEAKQRFVQEAKAASALDHANICTIHDIAETDDGELYIVMAFYDGQTLRERLAAGGMSSEEAVEIGVQLARALDRAHQAGIIHRDLKPANVLVTDRGEVKLLDFGVAKLTLAGADLTSTGTTLGTAGYMSPEQLTAGEVDARADLFSFGALMYELLGGRKAFEGASPLAVATAVLHTDPPPLAELRAGVPDAIARVVEACLAREPDDRPQSAREVVRALGGDSALATGYSSPPRSRPGGRPISRRVVTGMGGVLLAAIVAAVFLMRPRTPDVATTSDLLAVIPFSVSGSPDLEYLGEGIVNLLSARLDGAGTLETVDPRAVISRVGSERADVRDPEQARRVAAALGAGRYLTGDVTQVGSQITLTAYLHDSGRPGAASDPSSVSGTPDEILPMLDRLVAALLGSALTGDAERLGQLGTATTASLPAVKEFLRGEELLRAGRYREAAVAYDLAVAEDSTFALAWYRKSIAADWVDAFDVRSSADRALELSGDLSARDRALLQALQLRRNGRVAEAESAFRTIVHDYPSDVEAWVQLGEAIFHDTSRRGGSTLEAIEPFSKAVALEPTNVMAQVHVARLYALFDSVDALRRTADFFREFGSDSERALEVEAMYAYLAGDSAQQADVKAQLEGKPWFYHFYAVHGVSRFARDADGAADILEAVPAEDPYVMALVPGIAVVRGKYEEAYRSLAELRGLDNPMWDLFEAFLLTSGALPPDPERAASLVGRLRDADPRAIHQSSFIPPYEDLTVEVAGFHRDYFLALLLLDLGRVDEMQGVLSRMRATPEFVGLGSFKQDAVRSLEAELLLAAGDREGALMTFRTLESAVPHALTVWPLADMGRARFQRAELERERGDIETAKRFYNGLDEPWSPWDSYWRPLLYERLGEIAIEQGRTQDAIKFLSRLAELWNDADPVLDGRRSDIERRLAALIEGQPTGS